MKKMVCAAIGFTLITATAFAAADRGMVRIFKKMDADNDGKVTLTEFTEHWEQFFHKTDKNKDGVLDFDEFPDPLFFHLGDKNEDGKLDPDEYKAFCTRQFKGLDANKDGKLTLKEYAK